MTDQNRRNYEPVQFAGTDLDLYRHVCAFVNSREEEHRVIDPFVSDGFAMGDKVLYIINPAERAEVVHHLRHLRFDVSALLEQRQCEVQTWSETYLRGGHFDQDETLELFASLLSGSPPPRIRLVCNMGWAVEEKDFSRVLLEYESRANYFQTQRQHLVICVYDAAKFGGDVLIDVLRTHPVALIGGMLQVNPFFVPMAEFRDELQSRGQTG